MRPSVQFVTHPQFRSTMWSPARSSVSPSVHPLGHPPLRPPLHSSAPSAIRLIHRVACASAQPSAHVFISQQSAAAHASDSHPSVRPTVGASAHSSVQTSAHRIIRPSSEYSSVSPSVHPCCRPCVRPNISPCVRHVCVDGLFNVGNEMNRAGATDTRWTGERVKKDVYVGGAMSGGERKGTRKYDKSQAP